MACQRTASGEWCWAQMGLHTDVAKQRPWKVINIRQLQVTLGEIGASRKATEVARTSNDPVY